MLIEPLVHAVVRVAGFNRGNTLTLLLGAHRHGSWCAFFWAYALMLTV
jgi:hypothetical protein